MDRNINTKRNDYIDWNEYFMSVAFLAAKRSKDPCTQVGACIVDTDNKIVGVGYNGMPIGCSDDEYPWNKTSSDRLKTKYLYEMNAIMNKNVVDLKGCKMYVALFPCNECAKLIIQSGIAEVIYVSDKHSDKVETKASKCMFDSAGIKYWRYQPPHDEIVIDFKQINWNDMSQLPPTPNKSDNPDNVNNPMTCINDQLRTIHLNSDNKL